MQRRTSASGGEDHGAAARSGREGASLGRLEFLVSLETEKLLDRRDTLLDANHAALARDTSRGLLHRGGGGTHEMIRPDYHRDVMLLEDLDGSGVILGRNKDNGVTVFPRVQKGQDFIGT